MVKSHALRRKEKGKRQHDKVSQTALEMNEPEQSRTETLASNFRSEELSELCRIWNVSDVSEVSPLVAAVALNKVALVKRLIVDGYNLELQGPGGRTALLEAVRMRSLELVDLLTAHGADACAVDAEGNTALLLALRDEWWTQDTMLALCGLLPKLDVDRAAGVGKGHTLLYQAVRRNWDALVDALLERRAHVDCVTVRGVSPLMLAGCARRWQLAQRLLAAGANLQLEDGHGCTALCYACATLLVKGRNRETVELMLRHLAVPLEDYLLRRFHLLRHPPCAATEFAWHVSSIVAQALFCVSRHVRDGLRALLATHVFAHLSRSIDAHLGCVAYVHALLGLLFDLARHCACCTEMEGITAAQLAAEFVGGGAPDACLSVLLAHCVPAESTPLPDHLMRLLVAALLPLAVVFGRSPDAGADWLERRGAELAPFYAVFRRAQHISISSRTDLAHLRIVRRQLRSFHALYAGASESPRVVLSTEVEMEAGSVTSIESVDASATSLEGSVESKESGLPTLFDSGLGCSTEAEWKVVVKRGSKASLKNKKNMKSKSQTGLVGKPCVETNDSTLLSLSSVTSTRSESSLKPSSVKTKNEGCEKPKGSRPTLLPGDKADSQPSLIDCKASRQSSGGTKASTPASSDAPGEKPVKDSKTARCDGHRARRCAPSATSTPKAMSKRARRKDAEALEAYRLLPRSLDFGKGVASNDSTLRSTADSETDLAADSGLGESLELPVGTPLVVIYEAKWSKHDKSTAGEAEATLSLPEEDDVDANEQPKELKESRRLEESTELTKPVSSRPSVRLSEVDRDIQKMISSLELSVLSLYPSRDSIRGRDDHAKGAGTPKKPRINRIQVRLSDRRRLTVVDDLFTALVDALTARWRAEHAADYPGHRVLLSAGQDLTLSHLQQRLPPLERLHLARLVRRWRGLSRKLRNAEAAESSSLVGRLGALLQSHLAALAPGTPTAASALKRHASGQDAALRKRMRVGEATVNVRKQRTVRKRALKTVGVRAQNLKVIVPRGRTKTASYNVEEVEPRDAEIVGTPTQCVRSALYYQPHSANPPIPPPPGFGPLVSDLQATVNTAELRSTRKDLQYAYNAVNVHAEDHADDFASVRGVVDYLRLDDDTDFEDFLQRKALTGNGSTRRDDRVVSAIMRECSQKGYGPTQKLHEKWVPLRQPLRTSLTHDVSSLRVLRHDNLVAWETVTVSAAGLRIGCPKMQYNLMELLVNAGGKLNASRLHNICYQMARGMRFLHSVSLVHGNLKPSNVLFDEWGVARLADFGLHLLKPPTAVACIWWASETRAQFARRSQLVCTMASDAQVLGMLFHYAATGGQHPFVAGSTTPTDSGCACYDLRQLTQDLLQHESALRPTLRVALRHVCWWNDQDRRDLVLRCAGWLANGCAEQSLFWDAALEPVLPQWRVRAVDAMGCAAPETPSALLRKLHAVPQLADTLLLWLPELPLAVYRFAAQTPSLRALLRFPSHSTFDTI